MTTTAQIEELPASAAARLAPVDHDVGADQPKPRIEKVLTAVIVFGPLGALLLAGYLLWNHGIALHDVVVAIAFYVVAGYGITVGYHRLFTHRSFRAVRPLRIALAVAGSLAIEGGVVGWVGRSWPGRCAMVTSPQRASR